MTLTLEAPATSTELNALNGVVDGMVDFIEAAATQINNFDDAAAQYDGPLPSIETGLANMAFVKAKILTVSNEYAVQPSDSALRAAAKPALDGAFRALWAYYGIRDDILRVNGHAA